MKTAWEHAQVMESVCLLRAFNTFHLSDCFGTAHFEAEHARKARKMWPPTMNWNVFWQKPEPRRTRFDSRSGGSIRTPKPMSLKSRVIHQHLPIITIWPGTCPQSKTHLSTTPKILPHEWGSVWHARNYLCCTICTEMSVIWCSVHLLP